MESRVLGWVTDFLPERCTSVLRLIFYDVSIFSVIQWDQQDGTIVMYQCVQVSLQPK